MPPQNPSLYLRISSDDPKTPTEPDFDPNEFADFDPEEFSIAVDPTRNAPPIRTEQPPTEEPPIEEPGLLRNLWNRYNEPLTDFPSRAGRAVSEFIDPNRGTSGLRSILSAYAESLGDVGTSMTSPANLTPIGAGYGALKTGLTSLSRAAKGASALQGIHGGQEMLRPDASLAERGMGALEAAGGLIGMRQNYLPSAKPTPIPTNVDLPANFGPDAYAGPQRRNLETRVPSEDAVFAEYRERLARGEDVRSPASKKLLEQKNQLDESRKEAKVIERNGQFYEQTGVNPDTGLPTWKPITRLKGLSGKKVSNIEVVDEPGPNASGESAASREALNRQASMKAKGEQYIVYDRAGNGRPLIGPDAVDYIPAKGETLVIQGLSGRTIVQANGGKLPKQTTPPPSLPTGRTTGLQQLSRPAKQTGNIPPNQPPPSVPIKPTGAGGNVPPTPPKKEMGKFTNLLNVTKTLKSSMDFSAPLRQGLPLIHKKAWWTSLDDMVKAWGNQGAYDNIMKEIIDDPSGYFKPKIDPVSGKIDPSFAEEMGLDLTDIVHKREEAMLSSMLDKWVPGVKRSNRAYTAFLNKLRADSFKTLIDQAKKADPSLGNNNVIASNLAKFVNNATGRGSLGEMEKAADIINGALFSPRLIAGNVQRLNPANYIFAKNRGARLEYLQSMIAVATAWTTMAGLAKLGGETFGKDVDVSLDPTNSDFGKIKIGNTRMDPSGGLQTYLVALARMTPKSVGKELGIKTGQFTAPVREGQSQPKTTDYGKGYPPKTKWDVGINFAFNKASPPARFAGELAKASGYDPFNTSDQVIRLFMPMIIEDMIELYKDDPSSLWMLGPDALGMGVQTFGKDQKETLFGYKEPYPIK